MSDLHLTINTLPTPSVMLYLSKTRESEEWRGQDELIQIMELGASDVSVLNQKLKILGNNAQTLIEKDKSSEEAQKLYSLRNKIVKDIIQQVLSQVEVYHENEIVHLDIKERNVVFFIKGRLAGKILLIDFECSQALPNNSSLIGDIHYAPPEYIDPELRKKNSSKKKTDTWQIGLLLLLLLHKKFPFPLKSEGKSREEQLEEIKARTADYYSTQLKQAFDTLENDTTIDKETLNLVKLLLTIDPANRLTIKEALNDPAMINIGLSDSERITAWQTLLELQPINNSQAIPKKNPNTPKANYNTDLYREKEEKKEISIPKNFGQVPGTLHNPRKKTNKQVQSKQEDNQDNSIELQRIGSEQRRH
jgi:serine/threonine protein kinase